uniref:Uncharacterized protein n=1 Tax=Craspedostauros australis TaxID=1486917 RepID=A0A7R9ZNG5_9STRA
MTCARNNCWFIVCILAAALLSSTRAFSPSNANVNININANSIATRSWISHSMRSPRDAQHAAYASRILVASPSHGCNSARAPSSASSTLLRQTNDKNENDDNMDTLGTQRGLYLLAIALVFNIWQFSIPVEFRRTRFCSEEQVVLYPDSNCKTFNQWRSGILDYYKAGGGIQWDFSIEDK